LETAAASQLSVEPAEIVPNALIQDDLGADSLDFVDFVNFIVALTDAFEIKIWDKSMKVY
jgi:acyl carrier protein